MNECWCGRTRDAHKLSRWDGKDKYGDPVDRHDFSNTRAVTDLLPMLAKNSEPFIEPGWLYERKYDGMRALVTLLPTETLITSRTGLPLNAQFPELANLHLTLDIDFVNEPETVLDGEIVCWKHPDEESLEYLQMRSGLWKADPDRVKEAATKWPVSIVFFDVLKRWGTDTTQEPLSNRRLILEDFLSVCDPRLLSDVVHTESNIMNPWQLGWEGIVAKKLDSTYEPGKRRSSWKKWKKELLLDVFVTGATKGKGGREGGWGSLDIAVWENAEVNVGHVGGGFTADDYDAMTKMLEKDEIPVIEVEFMGWTKTGKLREPRFKRFRDDKHPHDCVRGA